jgi:hypothetical protein
LVIYNRFGRLREKEKMMILDIRKDVNEEIEGIKFDCTPDIMKWDELEVGIFDDDGYRSLCTWENFDNLIKALHKAKELAGKG